MNNVDFKRCKQPTELHPVRTHYLIFLIYFTISVVSVFMLSCILSLSTKQNIQLTKWNYLNSTENQIRQCIKLYIYIYISIFKHYWFNNKIIHVELTKG